MNIIESMRQVVSYAVDYLDSIGAPKGDSDIAAVAQLVAAYDALAPDWSQAPSGAQWYTIGQYGMCNWHSTEPTIVDGVWKSFGSPVWSGVIDVLLPGIAWSVCKWQRPESK